MMAFPSERQKTAERLARELRAFGGRVTNVLPLAEGRNLCFWVSDYRKNELLQQMRDAGYEPIFIGTDFQPCEETYTLGLVNKFELALPADQPAVQDRTIRGEIVDRAKAAAEKAAIAAMNVAIYGKRK